MHILKCQISKVGGVHPLLLNSYVFNLIKSSRSTDNLINHIMWNSNMDLSFSTGQVFWALLTSQARKEAELEQLKGMVEEIYAEIRNEDLDELKAKNSKTINNLYQEKLRLVFADAGMSKQNIDTILQHL